MHKTHIFDQKNNAKKIYFTDLPTLFFSDRYRKQTIFFLGLSQQGVWVSFWTTKPLTLPTLLKATFVKSRTQRFLKTHLNPGMPGIHYIYIALAEYTHMPVFQWVLQVCMHHFILPTFKPPDTEGLTYFRQEHT